MPIPKQDPFKGLFDNQTQQVKTIPAPIKRGIPTQEPFGDLFDVKEQITPQPTPDITPTPKKTLFDKIAEYVKPQESGKVRTIDVVAELIPSLATVLTKGISYAAGAFGGVIGGVVGGVAEKTKQDIEMIIGKRKAVDYKEIGKTAIEQAKATAKFGKTMGEQATPFIPVAITAPILLDAFMLSVVGKNVYDTMQDVGQKLERTPLQTTDDILTSFGKKGWESMGLDEETADYYTKKNSLFISSGIAINALMTYGASKGVSNRFFNGILKSGGIIKGTAIEVPSEKMTAYLKDNGLNTPPIPRGKYIISKIEPTIKGKLIQPIQKVGQKTKIKIRFEAEEPKPQISEPTKPTDISSNLIEEYKNLQLDQPNIEIPVAGMALTQKTTQLKNQIDNYIINNKENIISIKSPIDEQIDLANINIIKTSDNKWDYSFEINTPENSVASDFLKNELKTTKEEAILSAKTEMLNYIKNEMPNVSEETKKDFKNIITQIKEQKIETKEEIMKWLEGLAPEVFKEEVPEIKSIPEAIKSLAEEAKSVEEFKNSIEFYIPKRGTAVNFRIGSDFEVMKFDSGIDQKTSMQQAKDFYKFQLTDFYNQVVKEVKEVKPEITPIKNEILKALPNRPDFLPINASSFNKIVEKYGSKDFFDNLYKLQNEGKLEINHEADALRIFKKTKEVKPEIKIQIMEKINLLEKKESEFNIKLVEKFGGKEAIDKNWSKWQEFRKKTFTESLEYKQTYEQLKELRQQLSSIREKEDLIKKTEILDKYNIEELIKDYFTTERKNLYRAVNYNSISDFLYKKYKIEYPLIKDEWQKVYNDLLEKGIIKEGTSPKVGKIAQIIKEIPIKPKIILKKIPQIPTEPLEIITLITKVIPKKPQLEIINEFKVKNGILTTTDLDLFLKIKSELADGMYKLVNKEITKTNTDPSDFPIVKTEGIKPIFKIDNNILLPALIKANTMIDAQGYKVELDGIMIKILNNEIKIVSSDSYHLYQKTIPGKISGEDGEFIMGSSQKVAKILNILGDKVEFSGDKKIDFLKLSGDNNNEIIVKKIDGTFPSYKTIYPNFIKQYSFDRASMLVILKELKKFLDKEKFPIVNLTYIDGQFTLLVKNKIKEISKTLTIPTNIKEVNIKSQSLNDGVIVMPYISVDIKDKIMNYNINYLIDALNALEKEQTYFYISDNPQKKVALFSDEQNLISEDRGNDHNIKAGEKLFHGTTKNNAASIISDGIYKTKDETATYGKGVYLTPDYQTAQDYANEHNNGQVITIKLTKDVKLYEPTIKEREMLIDLMGEKQEETIQEMCKNYDGLYIPDDGRGDGGEQVILYNDDPNNFEKAELANEVRIEKTKIAPSGIASMGGLKLGEFEKKLNWKQFDLEDYDFNTTCVESAADKIDTMRKIEEEISYNKLISVVGKEKIKEIFSMYNWEGQKDGLKMKDDYAVSYYRSIYENKPAYFIEHSRIEYVFTGQSTIKKPKVPAGIASVSGNKLGNFEDIAGLSKKTPSQLKIYEKVKDLIKKYAKSIGEDYLPRNALGVYYPDTTNIRIKGMNNLSIAAHEITHFLDFVYKISDQLQGIKGYSITGNPIYVKETASLRKEMTNIYEKYYPGAKRTHKLEKRMLEGFAMLLQKYVEQPSIISTLYPNLVKNFLISEGEFYKPIISDIINDLREIITEYQGLEALDKIGSRIISDKVNTNKDSFLNFWQKVKTEISDNIYPIEALVKKTKFHFTKKDPSLWIRQYNNSNTLILNNINGSRGYWGWRNGELTKLHDFNFKDLLIKVKKAKMTDEFASYLVARREYFLFQELNKTEDPIIKEQIKKILDNDGFTEKEVTDAYLQNKDKFTEFEKMFDTLVREDIEFLHDPTIQIINNEQYRKINNKEGYASFKRYFYDEIAGEEEISLKRIRFGTTKISSLIKRTGSQKPIINPLFSALTNHAEITRKGLKQIVYNYIGEISKDFPNLFQLLQLKGIPDRQGRILFPQEKDPLIIMARVNYKRKPILTNAIIKNAIDEVLNFQNLHFFEKLLMGSSRFFTKGTTGLFPPFALTNYAVDQVTAMAQTRNNYLPLYDPLTKLNGFLNENNPHHLYFQEYLIMGGERQTFVGWQDLTANELFDIIAKEKKGLLKAIDALNAGMDILAFPAKWSEILTRATEYIKARQSGKTPIVALEEAGRVTAPFHHIGRWGGGRVGQVYVKSIPFFNPAIQVLSQAFETLETEKGRQRYAFTALAITAASIAGLGLILAFASDEQKKLFADLHPDELSKYLWLPNPNKKTLIKIRVPDQMMVIATLINMIWTDKTLNANYTAGEYFVASTSWLPQQFDISSPAKMLLAWIPQIIKPGVLTIAGIKDFPKVMPLESQQQKYREPGLRFTEGTSPVAKWLGEKLNFSPIKIDFLLTGYVGRVSGFFTAKPGIYDPFRAMSREYYFTSGRKIQKFYELKQKNDQDYNAYKNKLRKFKLGERTAILNQRIKLKRIYNELDNYKDIDLDKNPERATKIRNKILNLIDKL